MTDISRLRTILNNSGMQRDNNALYQVVNELLSHVINIVSGVLPGPITIDVTIKGDFAEIILQFGDSVSKAHLQVSLLGNRIGLYQNLSVDNSENYNLDSTSKTGWGIELTDSSSVNTFRIISASAGPNPRTINQQLATAINGLVTLFNLNLVGGNIVFPSVQIPATDPNTLDDYEEGTWIPNDASGAGLVLAVSAARYVKIGKFVMASFNLSYPVTANGNPVAIGGLPFTSENTAVSIHSVTIGFGNENLVTRGVVNTSTNLMTFFTNLGAQITNAQFSGKAFAMTANYMALA